MNFITGPKILIVVFILLYGLFISWYGGSSEPLTQSEVDGYMAKIEALHNPNEDPEKTKRLEMFRELARQDDGKEYFMVNLMKFREKAYYPDHQDQGFGDDVMDANDRYGKGIMPLLIKRGSIPVFVSDIQGRFIHPDGAEDWDKVGIVRYRSRRDILDMVADPAIAKIGFHKKASIEKTHVIPTAMTINFIFVRGVVGFVLLVLGGLIHLVLRNFNFYQAG